MAENIRTATGRRDPRIKSASNPPLPLPLRRSTRVTVRFSQTKSFSRLLGQKRNIWLVVIRAFWIHPYLLQLQYPPAPKISNKQRIPKPKQTKATQAAAQVKQTQEIRKQTLLPNCSYETCHQDPTCTNVRRPQGFLSCKTCLRLRWGVLC